MRNCKLERTTETKSELSRQDAERQAEKPEAQGILSLQHDPLARVVSGAGNTGSINTHAATLNRATDSQPSRARHSLFQLQRQYGNRYVQRVLALAREAEGKAEASPDVEQAIQRARSGGQALDSGHTDAEADTLNRALNGHAFTTGQDVFFRQGAYSLGSSSGQELLAHELTHVVQQTEAKVQLKLTVNVLGDRYEQEADAVARAVIQQEQQPVQEPSDRELVCRQVDEEKEGEEPVQTRIEDVRAQRLFRLYRAAAQIMPRGGGLLVQRRLPPTQVGPVSGRGGLGGPKRLSVIVGPDDTLRSIAQRLLLLWNNATPFTPPGATAPVPFTPLTAEQLAKGLLVFNRFYLAVPRMPVWRVGLRFPLPVEVNQVTGEHRVHPELMARWVQQFDEAWLPLLDQRPAATATPSREALRQSVAAFLQATPTPSTRGITLAARAMTNASEAEPFISEVLRQLGLDAFPTALGFIDALVNYEFDLLASQRPGLDIIAALRDALGQAPATLSDEQQASLARANRMLGRLGVFSAETAAAFEQIYIREVPGCHCMAAVYKGLEALYSPEVSASIQAQVTRDAREVMRRTGRDTNHMERIMQTVRARGKAGPMVELRYRRRTQDWQPDPEQTILGMTHPGVPGWYFFGLSLHSAYHSVILAVDRTDPASPRIYWMDQFSRGFTNEVTGQLEEEMRGWRPSYGFAPSRVWQFIPAADTLVELH